MAAVIERRRGPKLLADQLPLRIILNARAVSALHAVANVSDHLAQPAHGVKAVREFAQGRQRLFFDVTGSVINVKGREGGAPHPSGLEFLRQRQRPAKYVIAVYA